MNRNDRIYSVDADGQRHYTTTGLLLQFFTLAEDLIGDPTQEQREMSRVILDEVMAEANLECPLFCAMEGSFDDRMMHLIELFEAASAAVGEAEVLRIMHRPLKSIVH
jgi:hypothetical protein